MATAADYQDIVQEIFIAYFGRPADPLGLSFYENKLLDAAAPTDLTGLIDAYGTNSDVKALVDSFGTSAESAALYSGAVGSEIDFVNAVYVNVLGRQAEQGGLNYWALQLKNGAITRTSAALAIAQGASGSDALTLANKIAAAINFTSAIDTTSEQLAYQGNAAAATARALIGQVNNTTDLVAFQTTITSTLSTLSAGAGSFTLTTGLDNLTGTSANDTFNANVVQNGNGEQTNTLATGDHLNGGGGVDTLNATVQAASALNNAPSQAITPITSGLEKTFYTALTVNQALANSAETVVINAKSQTALTDVGSVQSDASLTIENLTTLTDSGLLADARNTSAITIHMDHTGNTHALDAESNLTVLFDNDYLLAGKTSAASTNYWLEDLKGAVTTPAKPLLLIDSDGLSFTLDGVAKTIFADSAAMVKFLDGTGPNAGTWLGFVNLLKTALAAAQAAEPLNVALGSLSITLDASNSKTVDLNGNALPQAAPAILLASSNGTPVVATGFHHYPSATGSYQVYGESGVGTSSSTADPITSPIDLYKVGRGADGGALTVGAMATDYTNTFGYKSGALKNGVEKFAVTVQGNAAQFSSLSALQSTNNTLRIVDVVTDPAQTGTFAALTIGNSNTTETTTVPAYTEYVGGSVITSTIYHPAVTTTTSLDKGSFTDPAAPIVLNEKALKDVQTFDASGLKGDLTLFAGLSSEVVAKYLTPVDTHVPATGGGAAAEVVPFTYTGGSGDNYINLYLDPANLAQPGTVTRSDLTLTINGGTGHSEIITEIGTGAASAEGATNWYSNQHTNAWKAVDPTDTVHFGQPIDPTGQLTINTGNADGDIVRTFGSGDWVINVGAGAYDTVYIDQTGVSADVTAPAGVALYNQGRAAWAFNQDENSNYNVYDLQSYPAVPDATKVVNLGLQVTFAHQANNSNTIEHFTSATVGVAGNVTGSLTGVTVNDLTINEAIKDAINNDPVLNKLLIAEDGPGRTLTVRSLIDGTEQVSGIQVNLVSSALTTQQLASSTGIHQLSTSEAAALGFHAWDSTTGLYTPVSDGRFDSEIVYADNSFAQPFSGQDSGNPQDSVVTVGTANNIIVLGTALSVNFALATLPTDAQLLASSNDTVVYTGLATRTDTIVNFDSTWITPTGQWVGGTKETFTANFNDSDGNPAAETIIFDGITVTLAAPVTQGIIPAADVANQFAHQYGNAAGANWTIGTPLAHGDGTYDIVFTKVQPGAYTFPTAAAFTGTYDATTGPSGGGTVVITNGTAGADVAVPATSGSFVVTFNEATSAAFAGGTFWAAGGNGGVAYAQGDGALTLATKLATANFTDFTAGTVVYDATAHTYSVTFSASAPGVVTEPAATDFKVDSASATTDGIVGAFVATPGVAASTHPSVWTVVAPHPNAGYDMLDFSSYAAKAVYEGASRAAGSLDAGVVATGQHYILLTDSTTSPGSYTIKEYTAAASAASDVLVGTVGVANFGVDQTFHANNFILG